MEVLAIFYILLGLIIIGLAHIRKHGQSYEEKVPVAIRMSPLKRWLNRIFNLEKS